jgi:hypothetical protein
MPEKLIVFLVRVDLSVAGLDALGELMRGSKIASPDARSYFPSSPKG